MPRQLPFVHKVRRIRPLHRRAGKGEGPFGRAAEYRADGERRAYVHGVADGEADHRFRLLRAPVALIALLGGEYLIFLCVVEVLHVESALLLTERALR
jgi:hypothetical protein